MCGNGRKGVYSSVKFCKNEFGPIFRYSARTRVIIEEKSVRIVQRMKNPAARIREQATGNRQQVTGAQNQNQNQKPRAKSQKPQYASGVHSAGKMPNLTTF